MTDKPLCPECGNPKVWLSSPEVWTCFKCEGAPERRSVDLWFWLIVLGLLLFTFLMIYGTWKTGTRIENLTQTWEEPDTGMSPREIKIMFLYVLIIALVGALVAYAMERGKERCPACGEVLRLVHEVQKYKCLHCGSWYPREDIEVEVVE